MSPNGSLYTDRFMRALLIHRNQTYPVSGLSPAKLSRSISYGITFPYNLRNFNPGQRGTKKLTKKSEPSRNSMF